MATFSEKIKLAPPMAFLTIGIIAFTAVFFLQSGTSVPATQLAASKAELTKFQNKLKETQEATQNKPRFQEEMERVSQTFRLALDYLPKELDVQDLLKKVSSEARAAGVELTHFVPKEPASRDFYDELPMEIGLAGTYTQLVTFLASVCKLPRIINIKNLEISSPTIQDGIPLLKMSGVLVGYRYKEVK